MSSKMQKEHTSNDIDERESSSTEDKSVGVTETELVSPRSELSATAPPYVPSSGIFYNSAYIHENHLPRFGLTQQLRGQINVPVNETLMPVTVSGIGIISLILDDDILVELTIDKAIRVLNRKSNIAMAISSSGSTAGLIHPNGRVFHYGSVVEILAKDHSFQRNSKYAKMWHKGISFTSDKCSLVYLLDKAGTRSTISKFCDLNYDFTLSVFMSDSEHSPEIVPESWRLIHSMRAFVEPDGTRNWIINGIRISQSSDNFVNVKRGNKLILKTASLSGSATVISPFLHCTGSNGANSHLFVKKGDRRMHYDGRIFTVRIAGCSAGFDHLSNLKVY